MDLSVFCDQNKLKKVSKSEKGNATQKIGINTQKRGISTEKTFFSYFGLKKKLNKKILMKCTPGTQKTHKNDFNNFKYITEPNNRC